MTLLHYHDTIITLLHYHDAIMTLYYYICHDTIMALLNYHDSIMTLSKHYYDIIVTLLWHYQNTIMTLFTHLLTITSSGCQCRNLRRYGCDVISITSARDDRYVSKLGLGKCCSTECTTKRDGYCIVDISYSDEPQPEHVKTTCAGKEVL